ncbi:zinc ribbon domain-containing protein [Clostridioides difficile]|nr:zinc ribbon domain-containing protein [Clostridioides difficile]MBG0295812.1 zinc ribbon domain-containing protein [Clostridioides difficile]MBH7252658.1 zinc ribbon domain-containing protein [Clostridioides difficile]MBH7464458.1 zinc ribbon domain-containing protein [Clostridioides difficile]HCQ6376177.1 zinc ribbon domain-containing protein [Clostridioides difficile]
MFCSSCGAEITGVGKFCSSCGTPTLADTVDNDDLFININGKELNLTNIYKETKGDKILAIDIAMKTLGLGIKECKDIIYPAFKELSEKINIEEEKVELRENEYKQINVLEDDNVARCPRCGSVSLSAHKKGFGIGKAVAGATIAGGIGLVAGNLGAKKVRVTCLNCGKQFWA